MGFNRRAPFADSVGMMFFTANTGENALEGGVSGHDTFIRGTDHGSYARDTVMSIGNGEQYYYLPEKTAPPADATVIGGGIPTGALAPHVRASSADSLGNPVAMGATPGTAVSVPTPSGAVVPASLSLMHPTQGMADALASAGKTVATYLGVILLGIALVLLGLFVVVKGD